MKRYGKFVLEAENGITFEVSDGIGGELVIRALNITTSANYANPIIPKGYKHICGKWNNGFVIEKCVDGSQFVWIPVEILNSNGTLDGLSFTEKFGRRNFLYNEFSQSAFHEPLVNELAFQFASVKKYGGFYISRYNISKNKKTGKPQSVKEENPWTNIDYHNAKHIAATIETSNTITSHLTFGAEYDSVLEWFITSKVKILKEIVIDSTELGNYYNTKNSPREVVKTGSNEDWCINNIYDFAGNVDEWTQEHNNNLYYAVRGGNCNTNGYICPVTYRNYDHPCNYYPYTGFRATLYIK